MRILQRSYAGSIILLDLKEGSYLDKFISNSHRTEVSHESHQAFYFVASHLKVARNGENDDRSIYDTKSKIAQSDHNPLRTLHPHNHSLLLALPKVHHSEERTYRNPLKISFFLFLFFIFFGSTANLYEEEEDLCADCETRLITSGE